MSDHEIPMTVGVLKGI